MEISISYSGKNVSNFGGNLKQIGVHRQHVMMIGPRKNDNNSMNIHAFVIKFYSTIKNITI